MLLPRIELPTASGPVMSTPSIVFPEMMLRAAAFAPPMVLPGESEMLTPRRFGSGAGAGRVGADEVPGNGIAGRRHSADEHAVERVARDEIAGDCVPGGAAPIEMPWLAFGRAAPPAASVPM